MRVNPTLILAAGLGLAAASAAIAGPAEVRAARASVAAALKDPASARFDGLIEKPGAVCGFVNARNGAGGYAGRLPFVYVAAERRAYVLDPAATEGPAWAAAAAGAFERFCS